MMSFKKLKVCNVIAQNDLGIGIENQQATVYPNTFNLLTKRI